MHYALNSRSLSGTGHNDKTHVCHYLNTKCSKILNMFSCCSKTWNVLCNPTNSAFDFFSFHDTLLRYCDLYSQVNYTRKVQHFAAYLVPLLFTPSVNCDCKGTLEVGSTSRAFVSSWFPLDLNWRYQPFLWENLRRKWWAQGIEAISYWWDGFCKPSFTPRGAQAHGLS